MNTLTYQPAGLNLKFRRQVSGLCFTEWLLVATLAVAYLFSMSSPIFGIQLQISSIKHLPMILLAPALALHFLGVFINRSRIDAAGIPTLPWIPDFQFKHLPELFPPSAVTALQKKAQLYIRSADGLILSSQAACDDAVSLFGADRRKLHVLRFAPKVDFEPLQSASLRDEVFARHGIARPYVFLPNQYWQHKNHKVVVQALKLLRDEGRPAPLIVSTGKTEDPRSPAYFTEFEAGVQAQGLTADYRILGIIPRQDMLVLLAHSLAVLNPSRFEGWSTTVEEAKSLGKPLLVSDIAVHREQVAGRSDAQCFGTDDAAALAALLESLARRHAGAAATSHPPRPDPSLYTDFTAQYIALLKTVVSAHEVAV